MYLQLETRRSPSAARELAKQYDRFAREYPGLARHIGQRAVETDNSALALEYQSFCQTYPDLEGWLQVVVTCPGDGRPPDRSRFSRGNGGSDPASPNFASNRRANRYPHPETPEEADLPYQMEEPSWPLQTDEEESSWPVDPVLVAPDAGNLSSIMRYREPYWQLVSSNKDIEEAISYLGHRLPLVSPPLDMYDPDSPFGNFLIGFVLYLLAKSLWNRIFEIESGNTSQWETEFDEHHWADGKWQDQLYSKAEVVDIWLKRVAVSLHIEIHKSDSPSIESGYQSLTDLTSEHLALLLTFSCIESDASCPDPWPYRILSYPPSVNDYQTQQTVSNGQGFWAPYCENGYEIAVHMEVPNPLSSYLWVKSILENEVYGPVDVDDSLQALNKIHRFLTYNGASHVTSPPCAKEWAEEHCYGLDGFISGCNVLGEKKFPMGGCKGSSWFFQACARALNIPSFVFTIETPSSLSSHGYGFHHGIAFPSLNRVSLHGDELYIDQPPEYFLPIQFALWPLDEAIEARILVTKAHQAGQDISKTEFGKFYGKMALESCVLGPNLAEQLEKDMIDRALVGIPDLSKALVHWFFGYWTWGNQKAPPKFRKFCTEKGVTLLTSWNEIVSAFSVARAELEAQGYGDGE